MGFCLSRGKNKNQLAITINRQIKLKDTHDQTFSLLQWNQLCQKYADFQGFPKADPKFLEWEGRKQLLTQEIEKSNADLICLQEVDPTQASLYDSLLGDAYETFHALKPNNREGIYMAYRKKKFEKLNYERINYKFEDGTDQSQSFCILHLKHAQKELILTCTHLKSKKPEEPTRIIQIGQLLERLQIEKQKDPNTAIILCGDFNTEPNSETIQKVNEFNVCNLKSVYEDTTWTTFKLRDEILCRVIDYIWYEEKKLTLLGRAEIPKKEEMGDKGLPNEKFPSDHYSLLAIFQLK